MLFRFDNLMEDWARRYRPIRHTEENRRFFRVDDEFRLDEFLQKFQDLPAGRPSCGIVTHLEGTVNVVKRLDYPVIDLLFFERADPECARSQADAKADCNLHAMKCLAWLQKIKTEHARQNREHPLAQLDLTQVRYDMLGPITNVWFYCQIVTIQGISYTPVCYSPADYLEDDQEHDFS